MPTVCQGLLSCRRHIGKREDPGDEVEQDADNKADKWTKEIIQRTLRSRDS